MNIQDLAKQILAEKGVSNVSVGVKICVHKDPKKKGYEEDTEDDDVEDEEDTGEMKDYEDDDVEDEEEVVDKSITRK